MNEQLWRMKKLTDLVQELPVNERIDVTDSPDDGTWYGIECVGERFDCRMYVFNAYGGGDSEAFDETNIETRLPEILYMKGIAVNGLVWIDLDTVPEILMD